MFGAYCRYPKRAGGHGDLYLLLISEVLDHDAQIANMFLNEILRHVRSHPDVAWNQVSKLWIASDVGPHFRSYENAAHFLCTLAPWQLLRPACRRLPCQVKILQLEVSVLYLGEQHGKGACDRLFGWSRAWMSAFIQTQPIYCAQDLLACYNAGGRQMQADDPEGARFVAAIFDPGANRPTTRSSLSAPGLKISRTYSLTACLDSRSPIGVLVFNNVFTDMGRGARLDCHVWSEESEPLPWRRGYYDKPRSWEQAGPGPGDENAIIRKFTDQKALASSEMPLPKRTLQERMSEKAEQLSRQASRRRRQTAPSKAATSSSSSSSSTGSSSSSSSE